MYSVRKITDNLFWVGANDRRLPLFENSFPLPHGVTYNSYLLLDQSTVLFDAVDWSACKLLMENLEYVLAGRNLDYLVVHHVEPDHAASIEMLLLRWPELKLIGNQRSFTFLRQFGFKVDLHECITVKDADTYSFGQHNVRFIFSPMVHWPEVMVTFDETNGVLFSADAFGTFGSLDGRVFADEVDFDRDWLDEARRYYSNIVGKYGANVQRLLKRIEALAENVKVICPLHGPVWRNNLAYYINKYHLWSRYEPEQQGVLIAYASMYGNTENAAQALASELCEHGMTDVVMHDVARTHVSHLIADAFKYSHIVLASSTYNLEIHPAMYNFLHDMKILNVQNRTVAIIENGSWACKSGELIQKFLSGEMKDFTVLDEKLTVNSALTLERARSVVALAKDIITSIRYTD